MVGGGEGGVGEAVREVCGIYGEELGSCDHMTVT